MDQDFFEGVSVTTVILAPGACGRRVRDALLATTSVPPVTPVTPVTSSKNADIAAVRVTSELATSSDTSLATEKPWPGYFGRGKTLGGVFWQWKNPGRPFLAAEKPWAGYSGCGKTPGVLFWLRKNLGGRYFGCGKTMHMRTFWKFDIQTLYF